MRAFLWLGVLCVIGCEGGTTPPGSDGGVEESIFPVVPGMKWTYRVTSGSGEVTDKIQSVTGTVSYEGRDAFRFETVRAGLKNAISIQAIDGDRLVRLEEWNYDNNVLSERDKYIPLDTRINRALVKSGDTYQDQHDKELLDADGNLLVKKRVIYNFYVEADHELVEVPVGRLACVRVRRDEVGKDSSKTYWFAPGIGKVKELGGQTEELVKVDR